MTGKDIIIYILENNLENEHLVNVMTVEELALQNDVGSETVKTWCRLGIVPSITIRDKLYILINMKGETKT